LGIGEVGFDIWYLEIGRASTEPQDFKRQKDVSTFLLRRWIWAAAEELGFFFYKSYIPIRKISICLSFLFFFSIIIFYLVNSNTTIFKFNIVDWGKFRIEIVMVKRMCMF
jgi:hypothetical protein